MKQQHNMDLMYNNQTDYKLLSIISMVSVTLLIVAMVFTYRPIEFFCFLTPGGVIPFAATYVIAGGIVTEIYGYNNGRRLIFGNFICIFIFNITIFLILKIPSLSHAVYNNAYQMIFNNSITTMLLYSFGFLFGDLINAFCISKWGILTKGKYFITRLIGSSSIGQIFFSIVVIPILYNSSSAGTFFRQFTTTILAKIIIIILLSYPARLLKKIIVHIEKIENSKIIFNPFLKE